VSEGRRRERLCGRPLVAVDPAAVFVAAEYEAKPGYRVLRLLGNVPMIASQRGEETPKP
jgi:hypothetical protein